MTIGLGQSVGLYFYRLSKPGGGAERMLLALANGLAGSDFEVHVISLDEADASSFYPIDPRVTWHRLGFQAGSIGKLRRANSIAATLRANSIRVLVGFVMSGDKTVYAGAVLGRVKLIAAERNAPAMYNIRYGPLGRIAAMTLLHLCDAVTVQFDDFVAGYPKTLRRRISAIANPVWPVNAQAMPDRPCALGRFRLLVIGRLDTTQKRIDCLIEAFKTLAPQFPDWDVRIVGDGPDESRLLSIIRRHGLIGRVEVFPSVRDVSEEYRSAHLFALPSRWEGFPNAVAEAMSHGLPPVGFRGAPGVCHLITDGATGWLADGVDNPATLASALRTAMQDPLERAKRGSRARSAMKAYAPEIHLDKWRTLLCSVAAGLRSE